MKNFDGIFPALITPFDKENKLDDRALTALVEHHLQRIHANAPDKLDVMRYIFLHWLQAVMVHKYPISKQGIECGTSRSPMKPLTESDKKLLDSIHEKIIMLF